MLKSKSNKLFLFNMKSINPIQKYSHIIESYASTLSIFVITFLFLMIFLISFGICLTPKLSNMLYF